MAKQLRSGPIAAADLLEYLVNQSDFSFEVQTLRALIARGLTCEHGGTYSDPVTKKPREFDIRATRVFGNRFLRLAVECKNLQPNYPLLISCLPRREDEAFHEIVYSANPETNPIEEPDGPYDFRSLRSSRNIRLTPPHTVYEAGRPVGKACDQVGRTEQGEITHGDYGVYEKWAQALSSADDLTYLACSDGCDRTGSVALSIVFPILVVPNGSLWRVTYNADGDRTSDPIQVDHCPYFVGRQYYHMSPGGGDELVLSHIDIVTSDGLLQFVDYLCGDDDAVDRTFPLEYVYQVLRVS